MGAHPQPPDDKFRHPPRPTCPMPNPQYPAAIMRTGFPTLALSLALLAPPAHAEIRAVVVGVSDYLPLDADLKARRTTPA